jgi:hypothetical protein
MQRRQSNGDSSKFVALANLASRPRCQLSSTRLLWCKEVLPCRLVGRSELGQLGPSLLINKPCDCAGGMPRVRLRRSTVLISALKCSAQGCRVEQLDHVKIFRQRSRSTYSLAWTRVAMSKPQHKMTSRHRKFPKPLDMSVAIQVDGELRCVSFDRYSETRSVKA